MPRYFFDVFDGRRALRDEAGAELAGPEDAYDEAASLLPEFAREVVPDGRSHNFGAAVRDEEGRMVYRAALLFRGEAISPAHRTYNVEIAHAMYTSTRSVALRQEGQALGDRLTDNIASLLALLETTSANVAASRRMTGLRGDG